MKTPNYIAARFAWDGGDQDTNEYPGYYDPSEHWNGFACPFFEREVAEQILKDCGDKFLWTGDVCHIPEQEMVIEPDVIVINGIQKTVWAVGAYHWTWQVDTEEEEITLKTFEVQLISTTTATKYVEAANEEEAMKLASNHVTDWGKEEVIETRYEAEVMPETPKGEYILTKDGWRDPHGIIEPFDE